MEPASPKSQHAGEAPWAKVRQVAGKSASKGVLWVMIALMRQVIPYESRWRALRGQTSFEDLRGKP